jgi:hypothetical protein
MRDLVLQTSLPGRFCPIINFGHHKGVIHVALIESSYLSNLELLSCFRILTELQALGAQTDFSIVVQSVHGNRTRGAFFADIYEQRSRETIQATLSKYRPTPFTDLEQRTKLVRSFRHVLPQLPHRGAWVFTSDDDAAEAITWCEDRGVAIPGKLSVIGLENRPGFHTLGLSCCEPDWDRIGYTLAHVLIGDMPLELTRKGYLRTPAIMLERRTTK